MANINSKQSKRLKLLLSVIKIKGNELAKKAGIPIRTFQAASAKQRRISPDLAEQIMIVTGVDPDWLTAKHGKDNVPQGVHDKTYTYDSYVKWSSKGGAQWMRADIASVERSAAMTVMKNMIWRLAYLSIACARLNKLWIIHYFLEKLTRFICSTFRISEGQDSVVFLSSTPYSNLLQWSQAGVRKKTNHDVIDPNHECPIGCGTTDVFSPLFLFDLSELIKEDKKQNVEFILNEAKTRLNELEQCLLTRTPIARPQPIVHTCTAIKKGKQ